MMGFALAHFLLSLLAAALKLRLPGLTGTMSMGFVFVLLGISELTLPATIMIACAGIVVQCYWRARRRPGLTQVLFNIAAVVISADLAYQCVHFVQSRHTDSVPVLMAVATCVYFMANSLLVAGVLSRVEGRPLRAVWERCYMLSLPYNLLGGVVAGLIASSSRELGWRPPLLMLAVMALAYLFCRMYFDRLMAQLAPVAAKSSLAR